MSYKAAKCPSCGASIQAPEDTEKFYCAYCGNMVIAQAAIAYGKVEVAGTVATAEKTSAKYIDRALKFLDLEDYNQAQSILDEASKLYPENYEIWWGLILASTSNLNPYIDRRFETDKWFSYVEKTATNQNIDKIRTHYSLYTTNLCYSDCSSELEKQRELLAKEVAASERERKSDAVSLESDKERFIQTVVKVSLFVVLLLASIFVLFSDVGFGYKLISIVTGLLAISKLKGSSYLQSSIRGLISDSKRVKRTERRNEISAAASEKKIVESEELIVSLEDELLRLENELTRLRKIAEEY